ncbi:S-layer homology domain-containing protein [Tepidibacter hydrothermalis]|uniref:S-layer homology domain-containing protein n=1 Tax=Tepidibacter hydrothermalis TaxID=3036126 RepID=A0ABY8EBA0_9FIRM|nr:S-layer homology domain-containing protein [Tepidibacter hydrothermalis]WFD08787.1 S-layer homology domain-containing protein [Tepidibacter hydrothermalis]
MKTKKHISKLLSLLLILGLLNTNSIYAQNIKIKDIDTHWAKGYIEKLINLGYINGYSDGTFRPENNITIAEFTKLVVVETLGKDISTNNTNDWYDNYIKEAKKLNIIKNGEFKNYDRNITRQEIARMIVRAANLNVSTGNTSFIDDKQISNEFKGFVKKAVEEGFVSGYPNKTFKPNNNATRAESTKILNILVNKNGNNIKDISSLKNSKINTIIQKGSKLKLFDDNGRYNNEVLETICIINKKDLPMKISDKFIIEDISLIYENTGIDKLYGNPEDYVLYVKVRALKDDLNPLYWLTSGEIKNKEYIRSNFIHLDDKTYFEKKKKYPDFLGRDESPDRKDGLIINKNETGTIMNLGEATGTTNFNNSDYIFICDISSKEKIGLAIKNPLKK